MEQIRATNALEPFIALSKSANSARAAADLITQATSAPNTYVFAELLQTPNVQALRDSPEHSPYLTLLELFAWGTYAEYSSTPALPALSPPQQQKLRLLSLLSLAAAGPAALGYAALQSALSLPSPRDLEDLVTTAIYAGLLSGSLDPARRQVCVASVAPLRDLAPGCVPGLQAGLGAWGRRCEAVLAGLEAEIAGIKARARDREGKRRVVEKAVEEAVARMGAESDERKGWKRGVEENGGAGVRMEDLMEVEEGQGGGRALRSSKRGGLARRFA